MFPRVLRVGGVANAMLLTAFDKPFVFNAFPPLLRRPIVAVHPPIIDPKTSL
jgi:hypothetical protein